MASELRADILILCRPSGYIHHLPCSVSLFYLASQTVHFLFGKGRSDSRSDANEVQ